MLRIYSSLHAGYTASAKVTPEDVEKLTSNVIHEIGSSSGIAVLLINFKLNNSSSNSKVKMAPGGVQVPTIK